MNDLLLLVHRIPFLIVTGSAPEIRSNLAHAAMSVAPLCVARGTQNKVVGAMAMAKMVIASPEEARGASGVEGSELFVAKNATEFVEHISLRHSKNDPYFVGRRASARGIQHNGLEANLSRVGHGLDLWTASSEPSQKLDSRYRPLTLTFSVRKPA